eukprot:364882-Chlamydomonas_euryale.AAC.6
MEAQYSCICRQYNGVSADLVEHRRNLLLRRIEDLARCIAEASAIQAQLVQQLAGGRERGCSRSSHGGSVTLCFAVGACMTVALAAGVVMGTHLARKG